MASFWDDLTPEACELIDKLYDSEDRVIDAYLEEGDLFVEVGGAGSGTILYRYALKSTKDPLT